MSFTPFLPRVWTGYAFHINYRGRLIKVTVDSANVKLNLLKGDALKLSVYGQEVELQNEFVTALQRGE